MGSPVAKRGDKVVGLDTHIEMTPSPGGPVPMPMVAPFSGPLAEGLSESVFVGGAAVAIVGSKAKNQPAHIPVTGPYAIPPTNEATVSRGSGTVFADDKGVARLGDPAACCNDPVDADTGHIVAAGTVLAGG